MKAPTFQCYCCGEEIAGRKLALVTMSGGMVDRAFIMKPEHVKRIDKSAHSIIVNKPKE